MGPSKIEILSIAPKGKDSSIVDWASSTITLLENLHAMPQAQQDSYIGAFNTSNMGPHSKSFVTFTPRIEHEVRVSK